MGQLQSIQILRFVAVAMVVIVHANRGFTLGSAGVDIFFVISGFIIARVAKGKEALPFISGRIKRIYPLYILASLPWALVEISRVGLDLSVLAASLTLWPVIGGYLYPYLNVGWTLSFEMLFYVGMAATLWRPALLKPLVAAYCVSLVLAFMTGLPLFRFVGNPLIIEFGAGVLISRAAPIGPKYGGALLALGIVGLLLCLPRSVNLLSAERVFDLSAPDRVLWCGIPAAMIVWGALQFEPWLQGRIAKPFVFLGDASYSIYLTHVLTIIICKQLMPWPLAMACAFSFGIGAHLYVEKPLAVILKRKKSEPQSTPQTATA